MRKEFYILLCILLPLLFIFSPLNPSAQVIHENPDSLVPTLHVTIEESLNYLIGWMQQDLESISVDLNNRNFTSAKTTYQNYDQLTNVYLELLNRVNMSGSAYQAIADNINFSRVELYDFIAYSESYDQSYESYTGALASGDNASAAASSREARVSYEHLLESYDRLRANTTVIEKVLRENNIDDSRYQASLNYVNEYMSKLEAEYGKPGYNNTNKALQLSVEPDTASVGGNVSVATMLAPDNGTAPDRYLMNIYFNNILVGSYTPDSSGNGFLVYTIPANVSSDKVTVHAEAVPEDESMLREFSNEELLRIEDIKTQISLSIDRTNASYGDDILASGLLTTESGDPVTGKIVTLYLNDRPVNKTTTDNNGSFKYAFAITPYTPDKRNVLYASYNRNPYNVYLNSTSARQAINITPKSTALAIENGTGFNIGDMAHVKGLMTTGDGMPVEGANVTAYIDGIAISNNTTDSRGLYDVVIWVPENSTVGAHVLYTAFEPGDEYSLQSSRSEQLSVTFSDIVESALVKGMPFAVFQGDRLDVNGTLMSGTGAPLAGHGVNVSVNGLITAPIVTDDSGNFNVSYTVSGNEPPGLYRITVNVLKPGSAPTALLYSGQVALIPYDKFLVIGGPFILIALLVLAVPVTLRAWRESRPPVSVLIDTGAAPKKVPGVKPPRKPAGDAKLELKPPRAMTPAPAGPRMAKPPGPEEKPPAPRPIKKEPGPSFSIDREIASINSFIKAGNLNEALTHTYLASRKIALAYGFDVPDTMTHRELFTAIDKDYPELAEPLLYILRPYELVHYAGQAASNADLSYAINGLRQFYGGLKKMEGNN